MRLDRVAFVRLPPFLGIRQPHPQNLMAPLAAGQLATLLDRRGFQVEVIDAWAERLPPGPTVERIVQCRPDVVALETTTPTAAPALDIVRRARRRHRFVALAYGQHATTLPATMLRDGTFVACIQEEAELTLPHLLATLADNGHLSGVPGIVWHDGRLRRSEPRPYVDDLDRLPFIDYSLFPQGRYRMASGTIPRFRPARWGFLLTSRGCPYDCIYCSPTLRLSHGKHYRAQSPEYVVDNFEYLIRAHGVNAIALPEDVFTLDRDRVLGICARLRRRRLGVPWVCQTRADCLDLELVREMKAAGCATVCLGVESGSERILSRLRKGMTRRRIETAVDALHAVGIATTLFFMVGNPGETYEEFRQTLQFARRLRPLIIQVAYFTPYPGSRAFAQLVREGVIGACPHGAALSAYSHYNRAGFNLSAMDERTLRALQGEFYRRYYLRPTYMWQYARHRLPYSLFDARHELGLLQAALPFLLGGGRDRLVSRGDEET